MALRQVDSGSHTFARRRDQSRRRNDEKKRCCGIYAESSASNRDVCLSCSPPHHDDMDSCDPRDPNHLQARGVLTVGATLLHRFYMRRSMADFKGEVSTYAIAKLSNLP